ncbi:MAG: efflux RND transporter periplasmic adaptor subunit [Gammaproteobacteria bacterium]
MKILVRLVLIAIVGAGLWYAVNSLQAKKQAELAAFANAPRPLATVAAETVTLERWKQFIPTIGALKAVQEVMVTSEVDGKITAIHFESGDYVEAGQKLIELDSSVAQAQLQGLVAAQNLRQLEFERSNALWKDKTVSKSDLDFAAARRDETAALVLAQRASIAQKVIRAPFSGRLGIRAIDKGEYLEPGMKIVSLRALDPIYIDFAVPERFFSSLAIGQTISFTVQAFPERIYTGTVRAIEPGVESSTRNIRVRAQSTNPNDELRPGMFAEISLAVGKDEEVLSISETAIDYTPYGNSVFIIEQGDGGLQVQRVQIETGGVRNGRMEVLSGLEVGQQIVALGHNKLRNGMRVKLDEEVPLGITR